jgi:hypothetical protein
MGHGDLIIKTNYLRRLLWFVGFILGLNIAGIVLLAIMMGGASDTPVMMTRMDSGMAKMVGSMDDGKQAVEIVVKYIKDKFPPDQLEVTTRQILGIIENVYKVSSTAVSPQEVENVKLHVMSIIERADTIVSSIPSDKITDLITTISRIDTVKINELLAKFNDLREIKIGI